MDQIPTQIVFRDVEKTPEIDEYINKRIERLGKIFKNIVECEVYVSLPHKHKIMGKFYDVTIRVAIPGEDIIVSKKPKKNESNHDSLYPAIRDAFKNAERLIKTKKEILKERRQPEFREGPPHGVVIALMPGEDYGLIRTKDNRELYFHRNAVLKNKYDVLEVGDEVRFNEEMGEKGPQVTSMEIVGNSGHEDYPLQDIPRL